jgi:hypothetical protein
MGNFYERKNKRREKTTTDVYDLNESSKQFIPIIVVE